MHSLPPSLAVLKKSFLSTPTIQPHPTVRNGRVRVHEKDDQSRGDFEEDPGSGEEIFEVEGQDEIDYQ